MNKIPLFETIYAIPFLSSFTSIFSFHPWYSMIFQDIHDLLFLFVILTRYIEKNTKSLKIILFYSENTVFSVTKP